MATGRSAGVPELGTHGHVRGYKQVDNRFDVGNALHLGGYQGHSGNTGWSDDAHIPFDQPERYGAGAYSRFIGGATGYAPSVYASNLQNTKTTLMPPATSTAHLTANALIMASGIHNSAEMQTDVGQTTGVPQEQHPQISNDDIAHHFVFRYYSLLHSNPAGVYNLYSKSGQLCKPDIKGNRAVATGHSEIKNYYSQFSPNQLTAVIKTIEVQSIGTQGTLVVLVWGDVITRNGNMKDSRILSQSFVLCGDQTRSRFHIVNDIAVTDMRDDGTREQEVNKAEPVKSVDAAAAPKPKSKPRSPQITNTPPQTPVNNVANGQGTREKGKIVLVGLPPNTSVEDIRVALAERMKAASQRAARIGRVELKRYNNNAEKSSMYAFVHVDSREAAEALVGEGLTVRGKSVNVDLYKRNNVVREGSSARGSHRTQNKPVAL